MRWRVAPLIALAGIAAVPASRITAGGLQHGSCQSSTSAAAPATKAGSIVHVVLAPARSGAWCAGTFRGRVWEVIVEACPVGKACPAIMPLPYVVGTFTFRLARG